MLFFSYWKRIIFGIVCVLGIIYALPNFVPGLSFFSNYRWLPGKTISLGLGLQGGAYLLMHVKTEVALQDRLSQDQIGVGKLILENNGQITGSVIDVSKKSINVQLANTNDATMRTIRRKLLSNFRQVYSLSADLNTGQFSLYMDTSQYRTWLNRIMSQTQAIVRRRVDAFGTKQPIINRQGNDNVSIQLPGVQNIDRLRILIGRTAKLTFHTVNSTQPTVPSLKTPVSPMYEVLPSNDSIPVYWVINRSVAIDGSLLDDAYPGYQNGQPVVNFRFNGVGASLFGRLTGANVGRPIAIVLDNKVISAPVVNQPIVGGSGYITGNFTPQSANDLAILLKAGALPAPLEIVGQQIIGPSLGKDSIRYGIIASIIGLILVVLFMVVVYGLFGIFASISLLFNLIFIFALLSIIQATLTLPGIAGIVLTIGMSVDANVLIFENIRSELQKGRKTLSAIEVGYRRAFTTIADSNITTFLAAFMLYLFGTGSVKGFAVTLTLGLISSVFSAVWLTRLWTTLWYIVRKPKKVVL